MSPKILFRVVLDIHWAGQALHLAMFLFFSRKALIISTKYTIQKDDLTVH
jgi:hypothetical protein